MECYHCKYDNNDDAIFCKNCGKRIDGKKKCNSCGKLIDYDSQFCGYCGSTVQELFNENTDLEENPALLVYDDNESKFRFKKISTACTGIFAMCSVFFTLLFSFFIGVKISIPYYTRLTDLPITIQTTNLFYYLGECYANLISISSQYPNLDLTAQYCVAIIGTVLSTAIIISVVSFAVIATIKYINYATKRSSKDYFPFVLATYFSYILGMLLFFAFNSVSAIIQNIDVHVTLNDFTIAGLVISTIFIVLVCVCNIINLDKQFFKIQNTSKIAFSILGIITLSFIAVFAASPSIEISMDNTSVSFNFFSALNFIANFTPTNNTYYATTTTANNSETSLYACIIIGALIEIVIIAMAIIMIATLLNRLSNNEKQNNCKTLAVSIVLSFLSIAFLITVCALVNNLSTYFKSENNISHSPLTPIILLIVSVINMTIEIIRAGVNIRIKAQSHSL